MKDGLTSKVYTPTTVLGVYDCQQPLGFSVRYVGMEPEYTWYELETPLPMDHGVLEFDESLTPAGLALELHVVAHWDGSAMRAWWELEDGTVLRIVRVGLA